jgi:hypothetical protein
MFALSFASPIQISRNCMRVFLLIGLEARSIRRSHSTAR